MNPLWTKWLRRTLGVGLVLAILGFVLGKAFLMAHRIYAGDAYNVENERVLWQTPLVMAGLGMLLSGGMEALVLLLRRPVPVQVPPSSGSAA